MRPSFLLLALLFSMVFGETFANNHKVKTPGGRSYVYRYYLTDKEGTRHSLNHPLSFLSQKALDRRLRQHLDVDSTDLPVSRRYVRELCSAKGVTLVATSRWQNTVALLSSDSSLLASLAQKSFVREARLVYASPDSIEKPVNVDWIIHNDFNRWDSVRNDPYGMARPQIEMLRGDSLHDAGLQGQGMTIAVLDGGFQNYDRIPAFQHARIAGIHDFVCLGKQQLSTFQSIDHGTRVFSAMAAYAPEVIIGTAPEATYWLLRCEETVVEQPVEEDFWTMAAEFADSVGVDVINSSLGYYEYDGGLGNYRLQDLDGQTAFISRSASMLAQKGIVLCNSAGNSGMGQWKKIGVPADAHDILTVGAIAPSYKIAAFSSVGPSQDGRVKPDVVALGSPAQLISGRGRLTQDMGTSFSTPVVCGLVTCLWQGLPDKTAKEIIDLVRLSADSYLQPTNIYGYGLPNFWHAYRSNIPPTKQN